MNFDIWSDKPMQRFAEDGIDGDQQLVMKAREYEHWVWYHSISMTIHRVDLCRRRSGAWRHQGITWTNVDLSSEKSSDILVWVKRLLTWLHIHNARGCKIPTNFLR